MRCNPVDAFRLHRLEPSMTLRFKLKTATLLALAVYSTLALADDPPARVGRDRPGAGQGQHQRRRGANGQRGAGELAGHVAADRSPPRPARAPRCGSARPRSASMATPLAGGHGAGRRQLAPAPALRQRQRARRATPKSLAGFELTHRRRRACAAGAGPPARGRRARARHQHGQRVRRRGAGRGRAAQH